MCSHLWLSHIMVLSLAPMCLIQTWKPPFSSSAWRSKTSLMHNGPFGVHCWASKVPLWPCLDKRRRGLCAAVHGIVYFMSGSDQFMTEHWSLRRCRLDQAVKCWQAVTEHVHMDGTQKKKTKNVCYHTDNRSDCHLRQPLLRPWFPSQVRPAHLRP